MYICIYIYIYMYIYIYICVYIERDRESIYIHMYASLDSVPFPHAPQASSAKKRSKVCSDSVD